MAITGHFVADFSDFSTAVKQAELELKGFEDDANRVGSSLARMGEQFSGRKIIQDATLMAEAVERIGGSSKLTERELTRVAATATEAVAKMTALGIDVPPALEKLATSAAKVPPPLQKMGTEATTTTTSFGAFDKGLSQVDKTLGVLGIHIGPEIQAIRELGQVSDKTATQIGAIGTAGLVVGAAVGGWQIGRMIAGYFDLDKTIATATASLMGWGNVAGETAAAKVQTLSRATQIAGRAITDMTEAAKINAAEVQRLADAHKRVGEEALRVIKANKAEMDKTLGDLQSITNKLVGTDAILRAEQYQVALVNMREQGAKPLRSSWEDIVKVMKDATMALELQGRTHDSTYTDAIALLRQYQGLINEANGLTQEGLLRSTNLQFGLHTAMRVTVDDGVQGMIDLARANMQASEDSAAAWERYQREQDAIVKEAERNIAAMAASNTSTHGSMTTAMGQQWQGYAQQANTAIQGTVSSWSHAMQQVQAGLGTLSGTVQQGGGPFKASRAQIQESKARGRYYGPLTPSGQVDWARLGMAAGGPVSAGSSYLVGEKGPELFRPKSAGTIVPNQALGGITVHVDARESFYDTPAGVQRLAEKVGSAVMTSLRNKGWNA